MKAAIYCRLSKEDDDHEKESESIQNQKSMLVKYAVEKGFDIYNIYCDEDYSGVDRSRPDFCSMLQAAEQRKFDIILVKTQARFTRDMELVEKYLHGSFIEWGIRFIAVVDNVDTNDVANKKSRQINGLINEWYLEDLSNNVRSVLDHKRKEGKYIATFALYGYEKDPQDKNRLVIDSEAAEIVKRIFALYLGGNGTTKIARILNEEQIPSPTKYKQDKGLNYKKAAAFHNGDIWGKATVYRMLTTRTYAGDLEQGRHKKVSYKSKKTVWIPREQWIVVPNTHEAIIEPDTFDRVQKMLGQKARGSKTGTVNPFAGKVFCGLCGTPMEQTGAGKSQTGKSSQRRYYRCRTSQRDKSRCAGQDYLPIHQIESLLLERIRTYAAEYFEPSQVETSLLETQAASKIKAKQEEMNRLQAEVQRRRKAMQELYLDKSSGLLGTAQFIRLNEAYLQEVEQFERRIWQAEQEIGGCADENTAQLRKQMEQRLAEIAQVKTLTRELVCLLVDKITVFPVNQETACRSVEIAWKF